MDTAIFYWRDVNGLHGIVSVYVDDFMWAGTTGFKDQVIDKLVNLFLIGNEESKSFKYVGLNFVETKGGCEIDQFQYISTINELQISNERKKNKEDSLTEREKSDFRSVIGQLNWVSTHSRPDISFGVSLLRESEQCSG